MNPTRLVLTAGVLVAAGSSTLGAQATTTPAPAVVPRSQAPAAGNPLALRATQLLEARAAGETPRVRFEWIPAASAKTYLLQGTWTTPDSWSLRSAQFVVDRRSATLWDTGRIAFDVSLPAGTHSWKVVVHTGADAGPPSHVSFDLR